MSLFSKKINKSNKGFTRTPNFGVTPKGGGFTLVETLVAISIFTVSILGVMSVLTSGIANTNYAKKKMIAIYLAQEGIEYIRNMRDTFVLYGDDDPSNWHQFGSVIDKCGNTGQGNNKTCYFDDQALNFSNSNMPMAEGDLIVSCDPGGDGPCPELFYNSYTGKYDYDNINGANSGFIRTIQASYPNGPNGEIEILSKVSWIQGSGSYDVTFSETLFNWVE